MKKGCGLKQKRMKEGTINCLFYLFLPRVSKKGLRTFVPKFSRGAPNLSKLSLPLLNTPKTI